MDITRLNLHVDPLWKGILFRNHTIGGKSVRNLRMRCIPAYPMGGRGGGGWSQNLRTYAASFYELTDLHHVFFRDEPKMIREDLGFLRRSGTYGNVCCSLPSQNFPPAAG